MNYFTIFRLKIILYPKVFSKKSGNEARYISSQLHGWGTNGKNIFRQAG